MFRLLHGKFIIANTMQPDGDTIRFKPDNVDFAEELRRGSPGSPIKKTGVNIRLEAIDALEKSQEMMGAVAARDELLDKLGFTGVTYSSDSPFTITSGDQEVSGYVLSNGFDNFGTRLVGFVYKGDGSVHGSDGSDIPLNESLVDESVNTALLSGGYVFPAFYDTLPGNLREHLATKSRAARMETKGIWSRSKGFPGDPLILEMPISESLREAVLWPKLYRRLESFLKSGPHKILDGFQDWLEEDPQLLDNGILLLRSNPPESARLHDVVDASGHSVELKFWPEDFIVQGHPVNTNGPQQ